MKKIYSVSVLAILIMAGFVSSCSENPLSEINLTSGEIQATIDGSTWKGIGGTGVETSINMGGNSVSTLTIVAAKVLDQAANESETIEITVYSGAGADVEEGEFDVQEDGLPKAQFSFTTYLDDVRTIYFATEGKVKITEITSTNIKGTFSGVVASQGDDTDTKEIKSGKFNVTAFNY